MTRILVYEPGWYILMEDDIWVNMTEVDSIISKLPEDADILRITNQCITVTCDDCVGNSKAQEEFYPKTRKHGAEPDPLRAHHMVGRAAGDLGIRKGLERHFA